MYKSNTTFDFLDFMFVDNRKYVFFRMLSKHIFIKVLNKISLKIFNFDFVRSYFLSYLQNYSKSELENIANDFYDKVLVYKKNLKVINLLKESINNNCNIKLASATIDIIASRISKEYNVEYISSTLQFKKGICTGKLENDLLGRKDKFFKNNIELIVTDNLSDLNLVKISNRKIILSKRKNFKFWEKQKFNNINIWEIK
ncbi:hypothetical protein FE248_01035 [Aliarcobacter cibarius]|nr:hypothetical protein [Aliarcobacter cibarius]TLT05307.1 hypothetical protein FE248_01035 [Aliarcobacter cibarius]